MADDKPNHVTIEEAASILGRSSATVRSWAREGRLAWKKLLGRVFFDRDEIERVAKLPKIPAATVAAEVTHTKKRRKTS